MRVSRFKIEGTYDGKDGAKVEIAENAKGTYDIRVRPKRSRAEYTFPLERVAELICKGALPKGDAGVSAAKQVPEPELPQTKPVKGKKKKRGPVRGTIGVDDGVPWYEKDET